MKINKIYLVTTWLLLAFSSNVLASDWQWHAQMEKLIKYADNSTKTIEIGSYWNRDYTDAVFSVSNYISRGWSTKGFDAQLYKATLTEIWNNANDVRILNDDLIRLAALRWRLNLKKRCVDSEVNYKQARQYFLRMLNSKENLLKSSAISGLGALGEKVDVDVLIELLIDNQDNFKGRKALRSLLVVDDSYALQVLSLRLNQISDKGLKSKIKRELGYNRVPDDRCSNID